MEFSPTALITEKGPLFYMHAQPSQHLIMFNNTKSLCVIEGLFDLFMGIVFIDWAMRYFTWVAFNESSLHLEHSNGYNYDTKIIILLVFQVVFNL